MEQRAIIGLGLLALLAATAASAAAYASTQSEPQSDNSNDFDIEPTGAAPSVFDFTYDNGGPSVNSKWKVNEFPKYEAAIRDAANRWGIDPDLLGRQLYQESRFRPDVIAGLQRSPVGALGIAQFMPETAKQYGLIAADGTDFRTNALQSIDAAAHYMHDLYAMFGDWRSALMAYNWGPGNVLKYNRGQKTTVPLETSTYVAQITADVPVA